MRTSVRAASWVRASMRAASTVRGAWSEEIVSLFFNLGCLLDLLVLLATVVKYVGVSDIVSDLT